MELVDLRDQPDASLLAKAYRQLVLPAFPHEEEREDLSSWQAALWGEAAHDTFHVVVARRSKRTARADGVDGICVHELFPSARSGLVSYIAVAPRRRRSGLARMMLERARTDLEADARRSGGELVALFGEVRDPARRAGGADSMAAQERLEVMERLGARLVLRDYVQPELRAGGRRPRTLMLVDFGGARTPAASLPLSVVSTFLVELYTSTGVQHPDLDPDLVMMLGALGAGAVDGKVPLLPLR